MFQRLLLCLFLVAPAGAQPPLPKAYPGGEYWVRSEHVWMDWEVCVPELMGRQSPEWPADDQEPGALLHLDWWIGRWPVVSKFAKGQVVQAYPDPVGGSIWKDVDGASWLRVARPEGGHCFVRAHVKFLKPVRREIPVVSRQSQESPEASGDPETPEE